MLEEILKLFDISSIIIFHSFLLLHCEEIFLEHVTLGQTWRKKWMFMTLLLFDYAMEKNDLKFFFVVIGVWCQR